MAKVFAYTRKKNYWGGIKTVQFGWPLGMPLVKNLGHGLWEVRSVIGKNKIVRIIFFMHNGAMILLHGFIKKSQKTLPGDIELAKKRMQEVINND